MRPTRTPNSTVLTWVKRFSVSVIVLSLLSSVTLLALGPYLVKWAQGQLVRTYLTRVAPSLPFQITKLEIQAGWRDWTHGELPAVEAELKYRDWTAHLSGPLRFEINRPQKTAWIQFYPQTEIHSPWITTFSTRIQIQSEIDWATRSLRSFRAETAPSNGKSPLLGVEVSDLRLQTTADASGLQSAQLSLSSIDWKTAERTARGEGFQFKLNRLGSRWDFQWEGKSGEMLWGDIYLDLPLRNLPFNGWIDPVARSAELVIGKKPRPPITLQAQWPDHTRKTDPLKIQWKTRKIQLADTVSSGLRATQGSSGNLAQWVQKAQQLEIQSGTLQTQGEVQLPWPLDSSPVAGNWNWATIWPHLRGTFKLQNGGFRIPSQAVRIQGLNLALPFNSHERIQAQLSMDRFQFRRWNGHLRPLPVVLQKVGSSLNYRLEIGDPRQTDLPLEVDGLRVRVQKIQGEIRFQSEPTYTLETALFLDPVSLPDLARGFCSENKSIPPAQVSIQLPKIELAPGEIEPTGRIRATLFDGFLEVSDMGFYDLLSEVPEIDFTVDLQGIRLDQLGDWLGFGEMDGILEAQAKEVTFQSYLPTQYRFNAEVKPLHHRKVVFSPDAMKNFVRLFAAEGLEQLPEIADWLAFGWPSRLFGGYDVQYAGISLFSTEGSILLETLDPPSVLERERKHFILYGPRFKMPLSASHYPLVIDATAMGNFVRQISRQLSQLAENQAAAKAAQTKEPRHEDVQPNPACIP